MQKIGLNLYFVEQFYAEFAHNYKMKTDYEVIYPNGDVEDEVVINDKVYKIRFTPKHAEHVMDNYPDKSHNIKHREIQSLVRKSIIIQENQFVSFCVGRYKKKIYQTVVEVAGEELLVKSSYVCNRDYLKQQLLNHEEK